MRPSMYFKDKKSDYFKYKHDYLTGLTNKLQYDVEISHKQKMFIIGSSDRCNVGDQAIGLAEQQLFHKYFDKYDIYEITGDQYRYCRNRIVKLIDKNDIVFIHGGGNLGTLWMNEEILNRDIIKTFKDNLIIILPQTLYLDNSKEARKTKKIYSSHKNLHLICREKYSLELAKSFLQSDNVYCLPDTVLLYEQPVCHDKSTNIALLCFRDDHERIIDSSIKAVIKDYLMRIGYKIVETSMLDKTFRFKDISLVEREYAVKDKLKEFADADIVITDRLHAMIFSSLVCTKVLAFDNCSHKISGVHNWIDDVKSIQIAHTNDDYIHILNEVLRAEVTKPFNDGKDKLHFELKYIAVINSIINQEEVK